MRWNPFKRAAAAKPTTPEQGEEVSLRLLLTRLEALERELQGIRFEWAEILDKIQAWANRQAARDRRALHEKLSQDDKHEPDITPEASAPAQLTKQQLRQRVFGNSR